MNPPVGERRTGPWARYPALLGCVVVAAAIAVPAAMIAPADFRVPFTASLTAAWAIFCAAVMVAVRYRKQAERARSAAVAGAADAAARIGAANDAAAHYAAELKRSESRRAAALAAFAGAAGRMQAMSTSMLAELREMEHRHGDPRVLADLLHLDHRTAQAGRLADSIAVLSGARSGRRWAKPIPMESILRGAMGRIAGYQRVRLRAVADIAIAGHAAEGVMHALAELLDNACNFSPPTTEVHVYAAEVPAGVVLTIEDSGLVMSDSGLRRAERAVSSSRPNGPGTDLSTVTGTRLGLTVVGHLARKHGLMVSFRFSAIGGTAVVVLVPRELTMRVDHPDPPITVTPVSVIPEPGYARDSIDAVLPKRQRGSTLAAVHPAGLSAVRVAADTAAPPLRSTPAALGAFQRAWAGRDTDSPATEDLSAAASVENDR